jgi:hypothetical protein
MFFAAAAAQAEDAAVSGSANAGVGVTAPGTPFQKRIELKGDLKADMKHKKDDMKAEVKDMRADVKADIMDARNDMKDKMTALKDEAKAKIEALKAKVSLEKDAAKKKLLEARVESRTKVFDRFTSVASSLEKTQTSINLQISRAEAKGIDVSAAKAKMGEVDMHLKTAAQSMADASAILSASTNELSLSDKTKLADLATKIKTEFDAARTGGSDAIKLLKDALKAYKASLQAHSSAEGEVNTSH